MPPPQRQVRTVCYPSGMRLTAEPDREIATGRPVKSRQEEYARFCFNARLPEELEPRWRPLNPVEEPPDYLLTFAGEVFAVEVTMVLQHLNVGGKRRSSPGVRKHLARFVDRVGEVARSRGLLRGVYLVSARPIENMSSVEADLELGLLDYISRTRDLETTAMTEVRAGSHARMHIRKRGLHKNFVAAVTSLGARSRADELAELRSLLQERVSEKRRKLERVTEPRILLLLDGLHCGTDDDWRSRIPLTDATDFHLICRITADGNCTTIYAERSSRFASILS